MEDNGLEEGEGASYMTEESEPRVVEDGVPATEVGWTGGFEVEGILSVPELDDPPAMVKDGEILSELPITSSRR